MGKENSCKTADVIQSPWQSACLSTYRSQPGKAKHRFVTSRIMAWFRPRCVTFPHTSFLLQFRCKSDWFSIILCQSVNHTKYIIELLLKYWWIYSILRTFYPHTSVTAIGRYFHITYKMADFWNWQSDSIVDRRRKDDGILWNVQEILAYFGVLS